MSKGLQIAGDLVLPSDAVTSTLVVYGGKGMGKTNFGSVLVEELHHAGQRFSFIDPMGVAWGLQHGARRGAPGLPVLILGGVHGDLPIEPTAASVVADLVVDEDVSVIIDISRRRNGTAWSKGEKIRFVRDYCTRLYERQAEHRHPLMQIIDEAARYAPQQIVSRDLDTAQCLGAIEMLVEEGRNLGLGVTLLTQRSARLNKNVAELADMMVAFRVVGPNSIDAIMDWLGEHIPKERHKALTAEGVAALGHYDPLPTGDALLSHWYGRLGKAERLSLEVLAGAYPNTLTKEEIAAAAGYQASGGGFQNALGRLRTLELIEGRGELRASEALFA